MEPAGQVWPSTQIAMNKQTLIRKKAELINARFFWKLTRSAVDRKRSEHTRI